jgi:hypothetical protein
MILWANRYIRNAINIALRGQDADMHDNLEKDLV